MSSLGRRKAEGIDDGFLLEFLLRVNLHACGKLRVPGILCQLGLVVARQPCWSEDLAALGDRADSRESHEVSLDCRFPYFLFSSTLSGRQLHGTRNFIPARWRPRYEPEDEFLLKRE